MKYTIISCTYNASKYLNQFFRNLEEIKYRDFELIIVDDNSSDQTYYLLENYKRSSDIDIKLYRQSFNMGPGMARNLALANALGDYILFWDIDDTIDLNIFNILDGYLSYDIIYFDYNKVYSNKILKCKVLPTDADNSYTMPFILEHTNGCVWGKLFKKEIIDKNDIVFPDLYKSEDLVFIMRYLSKSKTSYYLNGAYYNYFINQGSVMRSNLESQINYANKAICLIKDIGLPQRIYAILFCREILYDLTFVMISCGYARRVVLDFWKDNSLPVGWKKYKDSFTKFQYIVLLLISLRCYNIISILTGLKRMLK